MHNYLKSIIYVFASCASLALVAGCSTMPLSVTTEQGQLTGAWVDESAGIYRYAGVRYAAPATGDNRWRAPQPLAAWPGTRSATNFGPACYQDFGEDSFVWGRGTFERSEDCLYLNLWTRQTNNKSTAPDKRPVMVWFHGGSHTGGYAHSKIFDGTALAKRDVVVVTVNYRLGIFGFLAHPAVASADASQGAGNYGLLDKVAALAWVQQNIAAFGGDPDNVTIFGQSAGSGSVCALMAAPSTAGLFHKAIGQSASCLLPDMGSDPSGAKQAQLVSEHLNLNGNNQSIATALRALSAAEVAAAASASGWNNGPKVRVDGKLLTQHPSRIFASGQHHAMPLLVGSLANEGHELFPLEDSLTISTLTQRLTAQYGQGATELQWLYAKEQAISPGLAQREIATDVFMAWSMRRWAALNHAMGAPSYLYFMEQPTPAFALYTPDQPALDLPDGPRSAGAYHSGDLAYVFGNTQLVGLDWEPADHLLANLMADYWTNFAKTGNPNGQGLPQWPAYDAQHKTMVLATPTRVEDGVRRAKLDLFDRLLQPVVQGSLQPPTQH